MGDIHYIVDKLNSPPFSYNLTLLSFRFRGCVPTCSEKTPTELLQLISDIFSLINPRKQKHDVSKEDTDQTVERLVNFLKIIKYKPNYEPATFRHLLSLGDKDVVYPILKWVVPQPQQLEKRAFVGHYLSFPDVSAAGTTLGQQQHGQLSSSASQQGQAWRATSYQANRGLARQPGPVRTSGALAAHNPAGMALGLQGSTGHTSMPEEFSYDPDIMELKEEIKGLQQVFITTHKSNEAVKALNSDAAECCVMGLMWPDEGCVPAVQLSQAMGHGNHGLLRRDTQALKVRIKGLEEEKERLTDKVERTKAQVDKVADKASYMDVCVALRKQQDEEVTLSQQLQAQKTTLEKADAAYNKVAARLKELSSSFQEGSGTKLLEALTEDVKNLRFQVNERCPRELEKRQRRAAALQEAFTNGVNTESDLQRLAATAHSMNAQINEIMDRRAAADKSRQGDKSFMQLRQAQQMASMVNRKKEEVVAKLERLQEKKATLTAQFEKLTAADGAAAGMVSEEEWRAKYEAMKSALPQYKKMKKELGDIEAEVFVLGFTEEVLGAQEAALSGSLKAQEKKQGVAGFAEVVQGIEATSQQKSVIDEAKGMTLTEISRTVEEINSSINERKVRLAPQIKKLRLVRQQFADLETEHGAKKQQYDAALAQYEGRVSTLESEVLALKTEVMEGEQRYHLLNCQLALTDSAIRRVSSGPPAERLRERYQEKVAEAEEQTRILKERQREIKETHSTGLSQIDMMNDLVRLLQIKLSAQRRELGLPSLGPSPGQDKGNIDTPPRPVALSRAGLGGGTVLGGGAPGRLSQPTSFDTPTANVMVL
ncbi:hypothetical protein QJQ45_030297 [Haematococcus lacustris]|nr:hypothetical protein QJQ45_030297 [Haematococcus lacustris]